MKSVVVYRGTRGAQTAAVFVLLAWCHGLLAQTDSGWQGPYRISEGDVISVFVWKFPVLSVSVPVSPDGTINYPLVGELKAVGLTPSDLEKQLRQSLRKQIKDPQVTVSLKEVHGFRVYVLGEVLRPGMMELKGPVTVVQVVAMAGGFTRFAAKNDIVIYNQSIPGEPRLSFDYERFLQGKDLDRNIVLRPGDTVLVRPEGLFGN